MSLQLQKGDSEELLRGTYTDVTTEVEFGIVNADTVLGTLFVESVSGSKAS